MTEPIDGRGVDEVDAVIDGCADCRNRFLFIGAAHIQPPIAQVPSATRETFIVVPRMPIFSIFNSLLAGLSSIDRIPF